MEFQLRNWEIEDLNSLLFHANNNNIAKFMTDAFPHPYLEDNGKAFIDFCRSYTNGKIYAIDVNGNAIGGIGIHLQKDIYQKNAELGYWLGEEYWGRGIASAAAIQVANLAFELFDIHRLYARPFGNNPASQRVLEKAGFTLEARLVDAFYKNGNFTDELIYTLMHPNFRKVQL